MARRRCAGAERTRHPCLRPGTGGTAV